MVASRLILSYFHSIYFCALRMVCDIYPPQAIYAKRCPTTNVVQIIEPPNKTKK